MMGWCCRDGVRVHAQTRPRVEQFRNIEQIRIGAGDKRGGTLVPSSMLNDGRFVSVPGMFLGLPDQGKLTVCTLDFFRIQTAGRPGYNIRTNACFSQLGLAGWLTIPANAAWWAIHKTDTPRPVPDPGAALVMDLLTHPARRPVPVP